MKIIDCHCHVYPEAIAGKAVVNIGNFYDVTMSGAGTINDLLADDENVPISRRLIFSVATTPKQTKSINEFIARTVAEYSPLLSGLGTIHPESADIAGDMAHLEELGLLGVKMHHDFQKVAADDPRCMKVYEICEAHHLPVLLHTGDHRYDYSNPNRIKNILRTFPDLTLIGAHLGGWSIWEEAVRELADFANFYVDSSSSFYWLTPEKAKEIIRTYGSEKVLFGSDYPMWSAGTDLQRLLTVGLEDDELENILHLNAERLFAF